MLEDCTFEFDFCMACACASWYAVGLRSLQLRPENPGSKVCMGLLVVVVVIVAVVSFFVCVFSVPFSFVYGFYILQAGLFTPAFTQGVLQAGVTRRKEQMSRQ